MRVHLVNPPSADGVDVVREGRCMQRAGAWTAVWPPISLATIAAVLEQEGVECRLDDCIIENVHRPELLDRARRFKPDLFVINTATPSIVTDLELAVSLKMEFPHAVILAIGIHVTALPEESLMMWRGGIDATVMGEPELNVRDAVLAVRDGRPLSGIAGLAVREGDEVTIGPEREPADLDALPYPAWHLVRRDLYLMPFSDRPFLLIGTSRGCPFHCSFCADPAYYGHKLRTRSPEKIVEELRRSRDQFGIRDFLFWSESFTLKRDWTVKVLEKIIEADLGIQFVVNSRSDHVDLELLRLLKRAGCWMIGFGLESGSQRVLDAVGKKITVAQNRNAVEWAKRAGLLVTAHMVIGYPGETEDDIRETIEFADSLPLDYAQFYCAVPFPGSALYDEALERGLVRDAPWERFEQNFSIVSADGLTARRVMVLRSRAYRRFYSRPWRIIRVLREEVGLRGAPGFIRMAWKFREWI